MNSNVRTPAILNYRNSHRKNIVRTSAILTDLQQIIVQTPAVLKKDFRHGYYYTDSCHTKCAPCLSSTEIYLPAKTSMIYIKKTFRKMLQLRISSGKNGSLIR